MQNFLTTKNENLESLEKLDESDDINTLELSIKELSQVKERKMLFDRGFSDFFEEKQESKLYAVREKAFHLKEKIENNFISKEGSKRFVNAQIAKLKLEWPALFGSECKLIYLHVDLDSFYASVETLMNPSFKDVPLGVGSSNMLAACNYKAREYGVRAGMPGYQAKELCPILVITKLNIDKYNYFSELVMEVLSSFDSDIEIYGIDEACLIFDDQKLKNAYNYYNSEIRENPSKFSDKTLWNELIYEGFSFKSINILVEKIRAMVFINTKLTISAGMSVCRGLAKFSSKINKPNGQFLIESNFDSHILNLEVDEVNGIGKFTKELLCKTLEIKRIKDLRDKLDLCSIIFQPKTFDNLMRLSFGLSLFDNINQKKRLRTGSKSHGVEMSIKPISEYSEALFYLWNFSKVLESRILRSKQPGTTVTLAIKYINFDLITKRKKSLIVFKTAMQIFDSCVELLKECFIKNVHSNEYTPSLPIRMLGVRISDIFNLAGVKTIDCHLNSKVMYKERKCMICGCAFINEPNFSFQVHVNRCIDQSMKKPKEDKNTLSKMFGMHQKQTD